MTDPTAIDPYATCDHDDTVLEDPALLNVRPASCGQQITLQVAVDDQLDTATRAALLREVQSAAEAAVCRVLGVPDPA